MNKKLSTGDVLIKVLTPIVAVGVALLLGMLLIAVLGQDVGRAMGNFFDGSLGDLTRIGDTLSKVAPLAFAALAFAIANRCGLVNIGGDGQLYLGGIAAGVVAIWGPGYGIPVIGGAVVLILSIVAGFVAGGLWGFIAGWLKVSFGANEVITTVMLNYVAMWLNRYLIGYDGPLYDNTQGQPQSAAFQATFGRGFLIKGSDLTFTILLAVVALIIYFVFFFKMKKGYEMRVVGLNATAAEYAGIKVKSNALLSMFLAGGFGGLAGVSELLGSQSRILQDFSSGYGFDGIAVALLGQLHPLGMGLSAVLFAVLKSGGLAMGRTGTISPYIVNAIQAFVIILVVASVFVQAEYNKRKLIRQARAAKGV